MSVRIILSITALPGKGTELALAMAPRLAEVRKEPGCEQYEVFQHTEEPDRLILLERWTDQAALAVHAELNRQRPRIGEDLRAGPSKAERFTVE